MIRYLFIVVILASFAAAECVKPTDFMFVNESVEFCSDTFDIPNGIRIVASDITIDCKTAILRGNAGVSEIGILVENVKNVTIRNCQVLTFAQGLFLKNVTHSLFEKNNFFKNNVGVRMLYSYENMLRDNNDKSLTVPVSAIMSKFNVVLLGNKEIDRTFCEVNACNKPAEFNLCEEGDFYCSPSCIGSDGDCSSVAKTQPIGSTIDSAINSNVEENSGDKEIKKEIARDDFAKEESVSLEQKKEVQVMTKRDVPLLVEFVLYFSAYVLAFFSLRLFKR